MLHLWYFFTSGQEDDEQYPLLLLSSCPENTGHPSSRAILSGNKKAWLESPIMTTFFMAMLLSGFPNINLQLCHFDCSHTTSCLPWIPITSPKKMRNMRFNSCNAKLCKLELNNSVLEWCNTVHYASIHTIAFNVQIGRDGMILRWGKEP